MSNSPSFQELENARLAQVRWYLLRTLNRYPGRPRAESTLAFDLIEAQLSCTESELRGELDYLEGLEYVEYEADGLDRRTYKITVPGRDYASYVSKEIPGIPRPPVL